MNKIFEEIIDNKEFIDEYIDRLQNKTRHVMDYCNQKHMMVSSNVENKLYNKMNNVMATYYQGKFELMEKYNHELEFIRNIGESYESLDEDLKRKGGGING